MYSPQNICKDFLDVDDLARTRLIVSCDGRAVSLVVRWLLQADNAVTHERRPIDLITQCQRLGAPGELPPDRTYCPLARVALLSVKRQWVRNDQQNLNEREGNSELLITPQLP